MDREPSPEPSADETAQAALGQRRDANAPLALLAQLAAALRFLTVLPLRGVLAPLGEGALFFPLVGLALGGVLALLDRAAAPLAPGARAVLLVATLAALSGGRQLRGLARGVQALVRGGDVQRPGAAGAVAVCVLLLVKIATIGALRTSTRTMALLYAPMLARWSMVVLAFGSRTAGPGDGSELVRTVKFREFGVATVSALWVALANGAARGLLAILVLAVITICCRIFVHARLGGVTDDLLGAIVEVNETLVLATFTLGTR
ncbi:MAG TPA: adenosylcobinamide-GDP ribazoletransferase [Candidatus Binatia bacterium]|jgi:adenosylcobinamide-GDP ribazoletransferase